MEKNNTIDLNNNKAIDFIYNEYHYNDMLGKIISSEFNGKVFIYHIEQLNGLKGDIQVIWNPEVDFLRIQWDEDYWRQDFFYKGKWK